MAETLGPLCDALLTTARSYPSFSAATAAEATDSIGKDDAVSGGQGIISGSNATMENDIVDILTDDVLRELDLLMDTSNIAFSIR